MACDITTGLVFLGHFTGNANDSSGSGNNFTATNTTLTTDKNSVTNQAYDFNGSNARLSISAAVLTHSTNWSINMWVNPDTLTGTHTLYQQGTGSNNYVKYHFTLNSSGQMQVDHFPPSGGVATSTGNITTGGGWFMVTVTSDGTNAKFYINGTLDSTISFTDVYSGGAINNSNIGARDSSGSYVQLFDGQIDEVRLYDNRILDQDSIDALFSGYDIPTCAVAQDSNAFGGGVI